MDPSRHASTPSRPLRLRPTWPASPSARSPGPPYALVADMVIHDVFRHHVVYMVRMCADILDDMDYNIYVYIYIYREKENSV